MKKLKKDSRIFSYETKNSNKKKYGVEFYRSVHGERFPLRKRGFESSYDAIEWANETERELLLQSGTAKRVTVEEYYHAWMERNESYWSVETYHDYHMKFKNYLLPEFGKFELRDVTRNQFQKFITKMEQIPRTAGRVGYSTKTISTLRNYMSMLLNDAVYSGLIPSNKLRNLKIKENIGVQNNEIDKDTYARSIKTAERVFSPSYLAAFYLSLVALRHGEILGIQPRFIFEDHVHVAVARTTHQPEGGKTKTTAGTRDVPITPKIFQVLQSAVRYARQLSLDMDREFTSKSFIFLNEDATPWNYTRLNHIFDILSTKMGDRVAVYNSGTIFIDDHDNHRIVIDQDHNIGFSTTDGFVSGDLSKVKLVKNVLGDITGVEVVSTDRCKTIVNTDVDEKAEAVTYDSNGVETARETLPSGKNILVLNNPHLFPHKMRHAFATFSVPLADDPVDVMKIMGHTDFRMTQYYDNGTKDGQHKIINLMEHLG